MANPLGFLIWGAGEPVFVAPGSTASFEDGNAVSLIHKTDGFDFANDTFKLEMQINGGETVGHSFKMPNFAGKTANIINDPALTTPDDSFTATFINALCTLPAGPVALTIRFYANEELMNEGTLSYQSDGNHSAFKALAAKFDDAEGARATATTSHVEEQEAKREAEKQEREAANHYAVYLQNKGTRTQYVIEIHQRTLSETIHEVTGGNTVSLRLWRGTSYQLKVYDQDQSKDSSRPLAMLDESMHETTLQVV